MFHPTKRTHVRVRTSGSEKPYPFQVEVANKNTILCHVGRVYDPISAAEHGTNLQKSWPAGLNKISQKGLQKPQSYNKVELQYFNKNVKTNSAKIYYKGSSVIASRGKATILNANNAVGDTGYVMWPRNGPQHEYIILHPVKEDDINKWCLSAVEEGEITDEDIVIAYISNGTTVRQIWKSDVCADYVGGGGGGGGVVEVSDHPFKITVNEDGLTFFVREGTVNDVPRSYPNTGLGNYTVWLQTYPTPLIYVGNVDQETTEAFAWIKIGRIEYVPSGLGDGQYVTKIYQYVRNSLWMERFKCGDEPAKYWYSQI